MSSNHSTKVLGGAGISHLDQKLQMGPKGTDAFTQVSALASVAMSLQMASPASPVSPKIVSSTISHVEPLSQQTREVVAPMTPPAPSLSTEQPSNRPKSR